MKTIIVETEEQFKMAVAKAEEVGMKLACVSDAGLTEPRKRLTFLPSDAFTGEE